MTVVIHPMTRMTRVNLFRRQVNHNPVNLQV
jgi:hypothetical protein